MPITIAALTEALTNGIRSYNTNDLEFSNAPVNQLYAPIHDRLLVQIFGTAVTDAQNLHYGSSYTTAQFTLPTDAGTAAPNYKVKSYLNAPVVCPVGGSGTSVVTKIAFALVHNSGEWNDIAGAANELMFNGGTGNNAIALTEPWTTENHWHGDIFMVITVSPGISVTAGGYLTVKGWASGVSGSDSYTYVTLQSGS